MVARWIFDFIRCRCIALRSSPSIRLSIRRVFPTRAAIATTVPRSATVHRLQPVGLDDRNIVRRNTREHVEDGADASPPGGGVPLAGLPRGARRPRARGSGPAPGPLLRREVDVAAAEREPVRLAHGRHDRELERPVEVATMRRTSATCWMSFWPKQATSGSTRWNSFATTVSTPANGPGRDGAFPAIGGGTRHHAHLRARRVHRLRRRGRTAGRRRAPARALDRAPDSAGSGRGPRRDRTAAGSRRRSSPRCPPGAAPRPPGTDVPRAAHPSSARSRPAAPARAAPVARPGARRRRGLDHRSPERVTRSCAPGRDSDRRARRPRIPPPPAGPRPRAPRSA